MYAILVDEPGGEPSSYILPTGARTSESAMQLMSHRAEEYVDEQLEQSPTEDYTITPQPEHLQVDVFFNSRDHGLMHMMTLCATAIDEVV
ncbi:hypothetical protein D3C75_437310 [compost metagenome]